MKKFQFKRASENSLIVVDGLLGNGELFLALDTGASHTIIDLTAVLMAGYSLRDAVRKTEFETASGIVEALVFRIESLTTLGLTRHNIEIASYDFLGNNILLDIDGVIGLDFFKNEKICVDFEIAEISVSPN